MQTATSRGLAQLQRPDQVVEREAGVDDVLDDQDVPACDRHIQVLDQADRRTPAESPAVAGERDEFDRMREVDRTREIGDEDERSAEHRHEHEVGARVPVVARDRVAELADARRDLTAREVDLADARVAGYELIGSRPYF